MEYDMTYWYTAGAFIFVMMLINTYSNRNNKNYRATAQDYAYTVLLGVFWPFMLTAMAGAIIGAVIGQWRNKSNVK